MTEATTTTADRVIAVCEEKWDAYKGDCSGFVKTVAAALGLALTGQANDIVGALRTGWQKATDGADAAAKAAAGHLVIGGLEATPNGHVVIVVKGPLNREKYPSAYWGKLGGTGKKNTTINWSWNPTDRDNVEYFYTTIGTVARATRSPARVANWNAHQALGRGNV